MLSQLSLMTLKPGDGKGLDKVPQLASGEASTGAQSPCDIISYLCRGTSGLGEPAGPPAWTEACSLRLTNESTVKVVLMN